MPFSGTTSEHTTEYWTKHFEAFLKPLIERNLDAALAALLNPLYFSFREHSVVRYDLEINIHGQGVIRIAPSQSEREIGEWNSKTERWHNDERMSRHRRPV